MSGVSLEIPLTQRNEFPLSKKLSTALETPLIIWEDTHIALQLVILELKLLRIHMLHSQQKIIEQTKQMTSRFLM
jgi:hypothetical protein